MNNLSRRSLLATATTFAVGASFPTFLGPTHASAAQSSRVFSSEDELVRVLGTTIKSTIEQEDGLWPAFGEKSVDIGLRLLNPDLDIAITLIEGGNGRVALGSASKGSSVSLSADTVHAILSHQISITQALSAEDLLTFAGNRKRLLPLIELPRLSLLRYQRAMVDEGRFVSGMATP